MSEESLAGVTATYCNTPPSRDAMEMLMYHMRHPPEHAHTESKGARNNNLFHLAAHSVAAAAAAANKSDSKAKSDNIKATMLWEATEEKTAEYLYQTQAAGERGGLVHDVNAPSVPALDDTLQHTLQQLEAEQSRPMDMFASECAAREVAIRHHRLGAPSWKRNVRVKWRPPTPNCSHLSRNTDPRKTYWTSE